MGRARWGPAPRLTGGNGPIVDYFFRLLRSDPLLTWGRKQVTMVASSRNHRHLTANQNGLLREAFCVQALALIQKTPRRRAADLHPQPVRGIRVGRQGHRAQNRPQHRIRFDHGTSAGQQALEPDDLGGVARDELCRRRQCRRRCFLLCGDEGLCRRLRSASRSLRRASSDALSSASSSRFDPIDGTMIVDKPDHRFNGRSSSA